MPALPKVLFVEDDAAILVALTRRLQHSGFDVAAVPDGQTALAVAHRYQPDIALLDIDLPLVNGFELSRRINESIDPQLPVVFLTASKSAAHRTQAELSGAVGYLEKPVTGAYLSDFIHRQLNT